MKQIKPSTPVVEFERALAPPSLRRHLSTPARISSSHPHWPHAKPYSQHRRQEQCTCAVDAQANRAATGLVSVKEAGHDVLSYARRAPIDEGDIVDLVAVELAAVPSATNSDVVTASIKLRESSIVGQGHAQGCHVARHVVRLYQVRTRRVDALVDMLPVIARGPAIEPEQTSCNPHEICTQSSRSMIVIAL